MREIVPVIAIFILLTMLMTFPLLLKVNTHIPGFFSTDEPSLWYLWWLKYSNQKGISSSFCPFIVAPFGADLKIMERLFPVWTAFKKIVVNFSNEIFTYNIEILLSFLLSGYFVYLMVEYLLKNKLAAILSGLIYAFCPYHFARAWQHISLANIQWMPLYIFALLKLKREINYKNIIFAVLALFLVSCFDYYYLYFMIISTAVFIISILIYEKKKSLRVIRTVILTNLIAASIFFLSIFPFFLGGHLQKDTLIKPDAWALVRPFEDLFSQSARPLSYILPSTEHPIFGGFTLRFVGSKLYGESFTEHALYLGWLPLWLAFVAFKKWRKNKKVSDISHQSLAKQEDFYIIFFVSLALVAWFFSQPPWWKIGPIKIFMPSFFMYKILPVFRAYCRFGIVLMLAVAVLAGYGLKFILEKFRSNRSKLAMTILLCGLVLFEYWNYPPFKVIDVSKVPEVYYWLKGQPEDFTIAEYPLYANSPNEVYKFYQTRHEKKIINGSMPGSYANKVIRTITELSDLNTARVLKWMGVKYVIVHREDYIKTGLVEQIEELGKIRRNPGLKFIKSYPLQECPQKNIICIQKTGPIDVYQVTALPIEYKPKQ